MLGIPDNTFALGWAQFKSEFRKTYSPMEDYIFVKLESAPDSEIPRLFRYVEILNQNRAMNYADSCLEQGQNGRKLFESMILYSRWEKDRKIVLQKIEKYRDSQDEWIQSAYTAIAKVK